MGACCCPCWTLILWGRPRSRSAFVVKLVCSTIHLSTWQLLEPSWAVLSKAWEVAQSPESVRDPGESAQYHLRRH